MNVLQVLPELNVGGVERGTVDLAAHLVKAGHKSVVVSNGGVLVPDLQARGAVHYQLPVNAKSLVSIIRTIPRLAEIIEKENIDIVHARSRVPAWIAFFACRRTRRVFVTTCHGYYTRHLFSSVMGWGKKVIVLSNVIARHMIEDFGVPRERIRLIPRSVDLEKFRYRPVDPAPKKEYNVGIIGRLTPIKGHLYFIKAMARVAREVPVKIWIVGDAPSSKDAYKEQLRVLVKRLGLWENTQFLGNQKDIPSILSHLDLLVLSTTTQEAFGRVIIEAQAAGVPVVATGVGGVVDIIEDGRNGLLVPPADPQAIAEAVLKLIKDRELAAEMAEEAVSRVREKYSLELMVKSTLDVYEEALRGSRVMVMKFSSLGDIILSTAALKAIRARFPRPNYRLTLVVGQASRDIVQRCPFIDELITCDFSNRDKGLPGLLKLGDSLRKRMFDIAVDLQNNRKSHLLAALSLARDRYGYDNGKLGFLLNKGIKDDKKGLDPVSHQFRVLQPLGIEREGAQLELWPGPGDEESALDFLKSHWIDSSRPLVGINMGASRRWSSKVWPKENMAKLCADLARRDIRVVLTGTEEDIPAAEALVAAVPAAKLANSCGKFTVNQLACLVRKCSAYISADSAPLHIAAAVSTPFIALFGPTDPKRHLPPARKFVLLRKEMPCSPCYRSKCGRGRCMAAITPEEVLASLDTLLDLKR
ncbi:MAG: GT4 family glycosyltransferase PelF [Deltaproteobacteria bacterium]